MTTPADNAARIAALASFLGEDPDTITAGHGDEFEHGRCAYLVLTDEEASERADAAVRDSLWAFNVSFLSDYVPALRDAAAAKAWQEMQGKLCENAGPLAEALLGDKLDDAVAGAVTADGRGHFLSGYDGAENSVTVDGATFYIYRTN